MVSCKKNTKFVGFTKFYKGIHKKYHLKASFASATVQHFATPTSRILSEGAL